MKYIGTPLHYSLKEHLNISNFISSVYKATKQLDDFSLARFEIWGLSNLFSVNFI